MLGSHEVLQVIACAELVARVPAKTVAMRAEISVEITIILWEFVVSGLAAGQGNELFSFFFRIVVYEAVSKQDSKTFFLLFIARHIFRPHTKPSCSAGN